jgi:hypothetical protein
LVSLTAIGSDLTMTTFHREVPVAGSYGVSWQILTTPQVFGGNRLHLTGPGTLMDGGRNILDLGSSNLPNEGWYVPPATVPPGGTSVTLSMEANWTPTQQWFRSPDFTIQVVQQATPMQFITGAGTPTSATLHGGQSVDFGTQVIPRPLDFQQQAQLIPAQPTTDTLGSVTFTSVSPFQWKVTYTAPATITAPLDLTVRAIAHDPWFNLDPQVDFIVHLVPN